MKPKYHLQKAWYERFKQWVEKGPEPHYGYCKYCKKNINLGTKGQRALYMHSMSLTHQRLMRLIQNDESISEELLMMEEASDEEDLPDGSQGNKIDNDPSMKIRYELREAWLERFKVWLEKGPEAHIGYCKYCKKTLNVGIKGQRALYCHSLSANHQRLMGMVENDGTISEELGEMSEEDDHSLVRQPKQFVWSVEMAEQLLALYKEHHKVYLKSNVTGSIWVPLAEDFNKKYDTSFTGNEINKKFLNLRNYWPTANKSWPHYESVKEIYNMVPTDKRLQRKLKEVQQDDSDAWDEDDEEESEIEEDAEKESREIPESGEPPEWFVQLVYEYDDNMEKRHKTHVKGLKKKRNLEKKENKLLKQIIGRVNPSVLSALFKDNS